MLRIRFFRKAQPPRNVACPPLDRFVAVDSIPRRTLVQLVAIGKLITAMGESQIRIVWKRKPDGPTHRRQDDPPPKSCRGTIGGEETLQRPDLRVDRIASDSQSDPRGNAPRISETAQAWAKRLADKVGSSQELPWPIDALEQIAVAAPAADLRAHEEILEATEDAGDNPPTKTSGGMARQLR